jgi:hypothetical protein
LQSEDLGNAYKKLYAQSLTLGQKSDTILTFTGELNKGQEKSFEVQQEIINQSTAKNSRPIIELSDEIMGLIRMSIYNDGDYPITGIKIYFNDHLTPTLDPLPTRPFSSKEEFMANAIGKGNKILDIGSLERKGKLHNIYQYLYFYNSCNLEGVVSV